MSFLFAALLFSSALLPFAAPLAVLDVNGNALKPNTPYYMVAVTPSNGGGVTLRGVNTGSGPICPTKVGLTEIKGQNGIPVSIQPESSTATTVDVNMQASFRFGISGNCRLLTPWTLEQAADNTRYLRPAAQGASFNLFTISSDKSAYALKFCDHGICFPIGVEKKGSDLFVVLGGSGSFSFVFHKFP